MAVKKYLFLFKKFQNYGLYSLFCLLMLGAISNVYAKSLKCPDRIFSESELAEIVKQQRALRDDLPKPYGKFKTKVMRLRCLYVYYEYELPEGKNVYQNFTIDPYGEIMEFYINKPN